jgi:hypothetical protein
LAHDNHDKSAEASSPSGEKRKHKASACGELTGPVDAFCVPSFNVPVVDVIGAGDAGTAALCAGLAHKLPLRFAVLWAVSGTAMSLAARGAQASMPRREELQTFLTRRGINIDPDAGIEKEEMWPETCPNGPKFREYQDSVIYGNHDELEGLLDDLSQKGEVLDFFSACVDFSGMTLLHMAVVYGDLTAASLLLQNGGIPCIGTMDRYGLTPLDRAFEGWQMNRDKKKKQLYRDMTWMLWTAREVNAYGARLSTGIYTRGCH